MTAQRPSLGADTRGQLLLVGAVAVAVLILGLAVVTNAVLFTENVGSGESSVKSDPIDEFSYEAQQSTRELLLRLNHAERNVTWAELNATVRRNVHNYSNLLARSHATSGTVFVDVAYNETVHNATRIVQGVDGEFTFQGTQDWTVVPPAESTNVSWVLLNLDLRNTSGDQAQVVIENGTGSTLTYSLNRSKGGSGSNVSVTVDSSWAGELSSTECVSVGGRAVLDIVNGAGYADNCAFTPLDRLDPPYHLAFRDGQRLSGQFEIVVNSTWHADESATLDGGPGSYPHCSDSGLQPPCLAPVVWDAEIDMTYLSTDFDYETNRTIHVYGGSP